MESLAETLIKTHLNVTKSILKQSKPDLLGMIKKELIRIDNKNQTKKSNKGA